MEIVDKRSIALYSGINEQGDRVFYDKKENSNIHVPPHNIIGASILRLKSEYSLRMLPGGQVVVEGFA